MCHRLATEDAKTEDAPAPTAEAAAAPPVDAKTEEATAHDVEPYHKELLKSLLNMKGLEKVTKQKRPGRVLLVDKWWTLTEAVRVNGLRACPTAPRNDGDQRRRGQDLPVGRNQGDV